MVNNISGVTISKQYKVVSGSKASITYMSNNSKRQLKSLKEKKIEKTINISKGKKTVFSIIQVLNRLWVDIYIYIILSFLCT